jgi:hypothetical protein
MKLIISVIAVLFTVNTTMAQQVINEAVIQMVETRV